MTKEELETYKYLLASGEADKSDCFYIITALEQAWGEIEALKAVPRVPGLSIKFSGPV